MNVTIGDIRRAIEGLPDGDAVALGIHLGDCMEDVDVDLIEVVQEDGRLVVRVEVNELDDDDEFDDTDDGEGFGLDDPEDNP